MLTSFNIWHRCVVNNYLTYKLQIQIQLLKFSTGFIEDRRNNVFWVYRLILIFDYYIVHKEEDYTSKSIYYSIWSHPVTSCVWTHSPVHTLCMWWIPSMLVNNIRYFVEISLGHPSPAHVFDYKRSLPSKQKMRYTRLHSQKITLVRNRCRGSSSATTMQMQILRLKK